MSDHLHGHHSLTARLDQPLIGVLIEENGQLLVRYFTDRRAAAAARSERALRRALGVVGAWSDLDWDEAVVELDRIRYENPPTPSIQLS